MLVLEIAAISLDCADPDDLGSFYQRLLGGEILWANPVGVGVRAGNVVLVAQRVHPYTPPLWPGASVVHLDLRAEPDLDTATAHAIGLGATLVDPQPDARWKVLLDPAGHPFCITPFTPD